MHLTWSHHDHHENERALEALLQAAAHGHHHDLEATPEHDHSVTLGGDNSSIRKGSDAASTPAGTHRLAHAYDRWSGCDASRRGPPRPLFTDHCSLLL